MVVLAITAGALVLVAAGMVAVVVLEVRRHRAVARLTRSLADGVSGRLEPSLQALLDDTGVRVVYVLPNG